MAATALPGQLTPLTASCKTEKFSANRTRRNRCRDGSPTTPERQAPQPQMTVPSVADGVFHSWPRLIGCRRKKKSRHANLRVFCSLHYQGWSAASNSAAACTELRARPEMTVAATGPCIQIGAVFPRPWVGPAAFDCRRIGCSATPPGVEPQGGHATDQTSHGCMMKPIVAASSAGQQHKQR